MSKPKSKRRKSNAQSSRPGSRPDKGPSKPRTSEEPEVAIETVEVSEDVAELVHRLEAERDEALAARTRALADYRNFQRRAEENEVRAVTAGACRVARSIIPILDNFDLALSQDVDQLTVEQLIDGVRLVRDELFKALEMNGVRCIEPADGEEFDPNRHEAMFKQPTRGLPANRVVCLLQPGYQLGDLVLRPAKVAVSSGEAEDESPAQDAQSEDD